jgi:hypothetical protein
MQAEPNQQARATGVCRDNPDRQSRLNINSNNHENNRTAENKITVGKGSFVAGQWRISRHVVCLHNELPKQGCPDVRDAGNLHLGRC